MITILQIKAARALLGWKQEDLAARASLSLPSINNLERGLYSPRIDTIKAIQSAFEEAGIEFTSGNGVRVRPDDYNVRTMEGANFLSDYDEDGLSVLTGADTTYTFSCNERYWIEYGLVSNPKYALAMQEHGWEERLIIPDDSDFITSLPQHYRFLPKAMFGAVTWQVYADRFGIIEWEAQRATIIRSRRVADAQIALFNDLWARAHVPTKAELKKLERWQQPGE